MQILADATLPELFTAFPPPFQVTLYHHLDELQALLPHYSVLLCRSTLKVNAALLKQHRLAVVMTASSGRDHLDEDYLRHQGTVIFDAKGSNANAVVDYVCKTLDALKQEAHIEPQKIGIVGMGAVGSRLAQRLQSWSVQITCCDPLLARQSDAFEHHDLQSLVDCDVICLHPALHHQAFAPSFHLINAAFLKQLSSAQVIINAARGGVVDEAALLQYYQGYYCTDVFEREPTINAAVVQHAYFCTPHIAGHTVEAKIDAVRQLSVALHQQVHLPGPIFAPHPTHLPAVPYHPGLETQELKQAPTADLRETFLRLRAAHHRHGNEYVTFIS